MRWCCDECPVSNSLTFTRTQVGSSPIKLTSEKPKTTVDMFTKSKEGLKKNSEEKSKSEEEGEALGGANPGTSLLY